MKGRMMANVQNCDSYIKLIIRDSMMSVTDFKSGGGNKRDIGSAVLETNCGTTTGKSANVCTENERKATESNRP
jgi:hypothetical protein